MGIETESSESSNKHERDTEAHQWSERGRGNETVDNTFNAFPIIVMHLLVL